ncbi:MAG: hypothetical protein LQ338_001498 [Usnochroma carphineum]|nr:MAG: hypothetical protein LQ338_001498 [Usnochroma carphineum]
MPIRPIELYQTAIQMMYDLAQKPWTARVMVLDSKQFGDYQVLIMFINPQPPTAPDQLEVKHCVASLWRAVSVMTDTVSFCLVRSHLAIGGRQIGALSILPLPPSSRIADTNHTSSDTGLTREVDEASNSSASDNSVEGWGKGQIKDPDDPAFTINFQFLGTTINSKEVSMAVLEAMTAAAPSPKATACEEIHVVSPDGGCAIIIESVASRHSFTYAFATRALKLLYQGIIVPRKEFGDIYLELMYGTGSSEQKFGELRMLRVANGLIQNHTDGVANER